MAVEISRLLQLAVDKKLNEMQLTVGMPPYVRRRGDLRPLDLPPLTPNDTLLYMKAIAPERSHEEFNERGSCQFDLALDNTAHLSVSVFTQAGNCGIKIRMVLNNTQVIRDLDRRLSRRLDLPLRAYSSAMWLAQNVAQFASSLEFFTVTTPRKGSKTLTAEYRAKKYERPVVNEADVPAEFCQFILDVLDGNAAGSG